MLVIKNISEDLKDTSWNQTKENNPIRHKDALMADSINFDGLLAPIKGEAAWPLTSHWFIIFQDIRGFQMTKHVHVFFFFLKHVKRCAS